MSFVRALRTGFSDAFAGARYEVGRVAVFSADRRALRSAQHLADSQGLSYYDGTVTHAQLSEPSALELTRCCAVLDDTSTASLVVKTKGLDLAVLRRGEEALFKLTSVGSSDEPWLQLGFRRARGSRTLECIVPVRGVASALTRIIANAGPPVGYAMDVAVVRRLHLRRVNEPCASSPAADARPPRDE